MKLKALSVLCFSAFIVLGFSFFKNVQIEKRTNHTLASISCIIHSATSPSPANISQALHNLNHLHSAVKPLLYFKNNINTLSLQSTLEAFKAYADQNDIALESTLDFGLNPINESTPTPIFQLPTTSFALAKLFDAKPAKLLNVEWSQLPQPNPENFNLSASSVSLTFLADTQCLRNFLNACNNTPCACIVHSFNVRPAETLSQFSVTLHFLHEA